MSSFTEQIRSWFVMHLTMPSLGAVTFNSLNCVVTSPDVDFRSFVLLKIISERGVPVCEVCRVLA